MIYIEISDDGPGIPNDKKEKILRSFIVQIIKLSIAKEV